MSGAVPAGPAHAAALAALHAASFPPGEIWDAAAFAALLGQAGVGALLDPAGGMVLWRVAADEAEILTIGVDPGRRRQGLGAALLCAAMGAAAAAGASRMFLEVADRNAAAQALYAACGFTPCGLRRRYYPDGADAVVMACALIPGAAEAG